MVNRTFASCSELNLNLEVVARAAWRGTSNVVARKLIAFAERLNERQRNILRVWPCRRLRAVRVTAGDYLEGALARTRAVDRKGSRHYIEVAAFIAGPSGQAVTLSVEMAKAKKTKPRDNLIRWRVSLITKTPAKFVDFAYAPDAAAAEKRVAEEHEISETLRDRLVAIREDL